jgi:hypothetical protein
MTGPLSLIGLRGILLADIIGPVRAKGVDNDQFLSPVKAFEALINGPPVIEGEDIDRDRYLFADHFFTNPLKR